MQRTNHSGRGARVAEVVRTQHQPSGVRPSVRRWLVVVGLLCGAWFAGAACAAAEEDASALAPTGSESADEQVADTAEDLDPAETDRSEPAADASSEQSGASQDDAATGTGASGGSQEHDGDVGGNDLDTGSSAVEDGLDSAQGEPLGSASGDTGHDASGSGQERAATSTASSNQQDQQNQRGSAATGRIGDAVAAVNDVGRDAGRTVPITVDTPTTPDAGAAVSDAAATPRGPESLPGFDMGGIGPEKIDGAVTLPGLEEGHGSDDAASAERGTAADPAPKVNAAEAAPKTAAHAPATPNAAIAVGVEPAETGGSDSASGDDDSAPRPSGADHPEAAAVGSTVNTPGPGGMCAGYLPAAASAAPAAGSLQCARPALSDVPQDLSEQPTFSPD